MLKFFKSLPLIVVLLSFFQETLTAKNNKSTKSDRKIHTMYGGYEFRGEYELTASNRTPLTVKLKIGRDTEMTRCLQSRISPSSLFFLTRFSLEDKPYTVEMYSLDSIEEDLNKIEEQTPSSWTSSLRDFLETTYTQFQNCDSRFQFALTRIDSLSFTVRIKSFQPNVTITPKKGASLTSIFKLEEYSPKKDKIYRTFSGSVILSSKISPKGKKITTAQLVQGVIDHQSLITIISVDGVVKKIKDRKIKRTSFWYPHLVKHMKKTIQYGSSFLTLHENLAG